MFLQSALKILTLHTFFLSALMAVGMILSNRKKVKNKIFFGLFLAFSLMIFYFFLYESGFVETFPYLSAAFIPGLFLIGPMVFFLACYAADSTYQLTGRVAPHFIPAGVSLLAALLFIKLFGREDVSVYYNFFSNRLILALGFAGDISFTIYLILAVKKLVTGHLWNFHALRREPASLTSMLIFDIFLFAGITDILSLITGKYVFLQLSVFLVSAAVIVLFILNLVYPNFEHAIGDAVTRERERRSYLSKVDQEALRKVLEKLLQKQELYREDNLSLGRLASMAHVTSHQLSEFINQHYGKNFSQFINEFRIEKAKELLLDIPEFTILAIAYEVGFKSKSSFNDAFLKITGTTPSEFKKNPTSVCPDL
jgi:AraC-like DNA-binding protein